MAQRRVRGCRRWLGRIVSYEMAEGSLRHVPERKEAGPTDSWEWSTSTEGVPGLFFKKGNSVN